jgi:hypothetical protein
LATKMGWYKVVRFFADPNKPSRTVIKRCTEAEATKHCNDPESSSETCTSRAGRARTRKYGAWFDGKRRVGD